MLPDNNLVALMHRHAELDAMVRTGRAGKPRGVAGTMTDAPAVSVGVAEAAESIQGALGLLGLGRSHSWTVSTSQRSWYTHEDGDQIIVGRGPKHPNAGSVLARLFGRGRRR